MTCIYIYFFPPVLSPMCYSLNIIRVCTRTCSHKDDCGGAVKDKHAWGSRGTCTLRGHLLSPPRPWTDVAARHIGDASLLCLRGNRAVRRKQRLPRIQRQNDLDSAERHRLRLCYRGRFNVFSSDLLRSFLIHFLSSKNQLPHDATAGDEKQMIHQILVNFRRFLSLFLFWQRCSCNQKLCQEMCDGARK